jgi:hypothetical protein
LLASVAVGAVVAVAVVPLLCCGSESPEQAAGTMAPSSMQLSTKMRREPVTTPRSYLRLQHPDWRIAAGVTAVQTRGAGRVELTGRDEDDAGKRPGDAELLRVADPLPEEEPRQHDGRHRVERRDH